MKKIYLFIIGSLLTFSVYSQTTPVNPPMYYVAFAPCITTAVGDFPAKFSPALEIGRQWDVFSIGLDFGRTNIAKINGKDTSWYFEFRPNLNIFQVGKFVNTFTPGLGIIPGASQDMMVEMTSGIEYSWTDQLHINLFFGQYYYSGKEGNSSVAFFGVSIAKFFAPYHPQSLIPANK